MFGNCLRKAGYAGVTLSALAIGLAGCESKKAPESAGPASGCTAVSDIVAHPTFHLGKDVSVRLNGKLTDKGAHNHSRAVLSNVEINGHMYPRLEIPHSQKLFHYSFVTNEGQSLEIRSPIKFPKGTERVLGEVSLDTENNLFLKVSNILTESGDMHAVGSELYSIPTEVLAKADAGGR